MPLGIEYFSIRALTSSSNFTKSTGLTWEAKAITLLELVKTRYNSSAKSKTGFEG
jgi:hypothetical protein